MTYRLTSSRKSNFATEPTCGTLSSGAAGGGAIRLSTLTVHDPTASLRAKATRGDFAYIMAASRVLTPRGATA
jgi:hypothetical protein